MRAHRSYGKMNRGQMGVRSALYQSQRDRRLLSRGHPDLASDVDNDAALVAFLARQTLLKREAEEERKRLEEEGG